MPTTCDSKKFRSVMGRFATGVTIVSYERDGEPAGMTANAFLSVSLTPQLILISVRSESRFCHAVKVGTRFCVNFLRKEQEVVSGHFGGRPHEGLDVPFQYEQGVPLIEGSLAHIVVRTHAIHEAGDHQLYVAEVEHIREDETAEPLLFYAGKYRQMHVEEALEAA
ncbi:flavin reductase family protein [Burkholderia multivorans]|nr:flavin reductase family protein [Burkholderia multivorans]MBU9366708.1 flavin reductase family protein [Burkholderia multivorans]MCA8485871.1 flavin reductase family protein [Burkholderia multivorans]